eukprot:6192374-Pleurochrysis_carterae.AAC.3
MPTAILHSYVPGWNRRRDLKVNCTLLEYLRVRCINRVCMSTKPHSGHQMRPSLANADMKQPSRKLASTPRVSQDPVPRHAPPSIFYFAPTARVCPSSAAQESIYQVINTIYSVAAFSSECLVISLLYIERLRANTGAPRARSSPPM